MLCSTDGCPVVAGVKGKRIIDKEENERIDGLAVNGERKIPREGDVLCILTGKESIVRRIRPTVPELQPTRL